MKFLTFGYNTINIRSHDVVMSVTADPCSRALLYSSVLKIHHTLALKCQRSTTWEIKLAQKYNDLCVKFTKTSLS